MNKLVKKMENYSVLNLWNHDKVMWLTIIDKSDGVIYRMMKRLNGGENPVILRIVIAPSDDLLCLGYTDLVPE